MKDKRKGSKESSSEIRSIIIAEEHFLFHAEFE